jgi:hypothetical protein
MAAACNSTARALGIEVPNSLQLLADEVIEQGLLAAIAHSRLWHDAADGGRARIRSLSEVKRTSAAAAPRLARALLTPTGPYGRKFAVLHNLPSTVLG